MRGLVRLTAAGALATGLFAAAGATASAAPACPSGAVCIARPTGSTTVYYGAGTYDLNLYGTYLVTDNGSGPVLLCTQPGGAYCPIRLAPHTSVSVDLTPIHWMIIEA